MEDLNFELKNNTIVVRLGEQKNFCIIVRKDNDELTEEYHPIASMPNSSVEVKVLDLSWKNAPKPGEEYEILGRVQDSKTGNWGNWNILKWTAPGQKPMVPRIKNPPTPAEPPPTVPDPAISATSPDPDPSPSPTDEQVIVQINERLSVIETDLDGILESFRLKAVPPQKYLLRVEKTLSEVLTAMEEIAVQVKEGLKTSPASYKQVSEKFETCREKAAKASKCLKRAQDELLVRQTQRPAPAATAMPAMAARVGPDPISNRINKLEQQLKDVTDQLADKASSGDLTALSGSVNSLGAQVTGLEGQVSGLETVIENARETSNDRLDQLTAAIGTLTANIAAQATNTTPAATPAVATAAMTATPATNVATAATPANVAATTPVVAPATNHGGSNKKSSESVNFFALALSIVLGVLALIAIFFYATRSQDISAERIGTSDTKSAALAEIENARRLQVEMIDRIHNLQQDVEGYRRQTFVTPSEPAPAKNNAVTNTSTTTNVVTGTNFTQITYSVPSDVCDPRPPMIQRGSYVNGFWSPTLMQNRYGYHRGFNGYIYPQ